MNIQLIFLEGLRLANCCMAYVVICMPINGRLYLEMLILVVRLMDCNRKIGGKSCPPGFHLSFLANSAIMSTPALSVHIQ